MYYVHEDHDLYNVRLLCCFTLYLMLNLFPLLQVVYVLCKCFGGLVCRKAFREAFRFVRLFLFLSLHLLLVLDGFVACDRALLLFCLAVFVAVAIY